ncbi:MAG: porin [Desulfobacterales bacterium]|nr:porin [Desulfobacterales bacterium]
MKNKITKFFTGLIFSGTFLLSTSTFAAELAGVDIHGFISQGAIMSDQYHYLTNDSKDGSFQYNEIGINFGKDLTDDLRVGLQLFSRDLGDVANNKITVDWAYGDYRFQDWFGLRAGRIKLPLGLYNETRDVDLLRNSIVMPQSIYNDLLRDTVIAINGAGAYGNIDMSSAGSLDYQALVGQMNVDSDSGFKKYFDSRFYYNGLTLRDDPDTDISYVGSLRWNTPLEGWIIGVSGMTMKTDNPILVGGVVSTTQETDNMLFTLSTEYTWNELVLAAEYQTFEVDSNINGTKSEVTSEGYYLSASYRFNDLFTLGAYYSIFYPDKDDKDGDTLSLSGAPKWDAWEKDLALTLRFDINDHVVFKVEGHSVDGTARVNRTDNPTRDEDDFYYAVAKVTFSF